MNIFYLGQPSQAFEAAEWPDPPRHLNDEPLFALDVLFVFAEGLRTEERNSCRLVERSGRPVVRVGAVNLPVSRNGGANVLMVREFTPGEELVFMDWVSHRPRTNYRPVDCGFYDLIESLIVAGAPVPVVYTHADGKIFATTIKLKATRTDRKEEYVQLEDDCWLRMDRIVEVDGNQPPVRKRR